MPLKKPLGPWGLAIMQSFYAVRSKRQGMSELASLYRKMAAANVRSGPAQLPPQEMSR